MSDQIVTTIDQGRAATHAAPGARPDHTAHRLHMTTVQQLGALAAYVDQLSAKYPLNANPTLRSQMRRAAIDCLTHAACDLESISARDHRDLMLRTIGALGELDTFSRLGAQAGALTPSELHHVVTRTALATKAVRLNLEGFVTDLKGAA